MRVETMPGSFDVWLAERAARQHGVVARWQILRDGFSRQMVERRIGRTLHPVYRGVYAVGHPELAPRGRLTAAALVGGPGSAVSHRSAAEMWGMLEGPSAMIHITAPGRGAAAQRPGLVVHRSARLPRTVVDGIPVTTPARTLVDLAATAPRRLVDRAVAGAERQRVFDLQAVKAEMLRRPGARVLTAAIAHLDDAPTNEELEVRFLELCARHGIPRPEVNAPVGRFTVDFLWRDQRVAVETDGMATHGTATAAVADRRRDAALTRAGIRSQRFTWHQVTRAGEEADTVATVRALLDPVR
jgi:predicted transcriptional regulator of viral defense system